MKYLIILATLILTGCVSTDFTQGEYNGDATVIVIYPSSGLTPVGIADATTNNIVKPTVNITINNIDYGNIEMGECRRITIPSGIYNYNVTPTVAIEWGFESNKITYLKAESKNFATSTALFALTKTPTMECEL